MQQRISQQKAKIIFKTLQCGGKVKVLIAANIITRECLLRYQGVQWKSPPRYKCEIYNKGKWLFTYFYPF
jgi:hypothetical protein